jgi:hypothetical protein
MISGAVCQLCAPLTMAQKRTSPITEITYEETSSWQGLMARYVFRPNGEASMTVPNFRSETPRTVTFTGKFPHFRTLAESLATSGFFKLQGRCTADEYDASMVVISAVRNGKRKTIRDYGRACPASFIETADLIRRLARGVKWSRFG